MTDANCPSCGGPISLANPGIVTSVCKHCESVVYWDADAVRAAGFKARLTEGYTRLFLGAVGEFGGHHGVVVGRVRYRYAAGSWDEWYVNLGGRYVWVTEDDHELAMESPERRAASPVSAAARVADKFEVEGVEFHVEEVGEAVCAGVEGELPERYELGETYRFLDASSVDGKRTLSIEFDEDPPALFFGLWLGPASVQLLADRGSTAAGVRPRPPHEPRSVQCPSCASPMTIADEAARLRVCGACGSHVELDEAEARVVAKRTGTEPDFALALGHPFLHQGERFEVIARLRWCESDDLSDTGDHYLLYSPIRGTLWLDEYEGAWTLTRTSHAAPLGIARATPSRLTTGDGKRWSSPDIGTLVLRYVDGALPWAAKVGDRVRYAEYTGPAGSFEIVDEGGEVTYAIGERVSHAAVGVAARAPREEDDDEDEGVRLPSTISGHTWLGGALVTALAIGIAGAVITPGVEVAHVSLSAEELQEGAVTPSFTAVEGDILEARIVAPDLDNAWLVADIALVDDQDMAVILADADAEAYHGYEDGESWTEGDGSGSVWMEVPRDGTWHVYTQAVSGKGDTTTSTVNTERAGVTVFMGGRPWLSAIVGLVVCAVGGMLGLAAIKTSTPRFSIPVAAFYTIVLVLSLVGLQAGFGVEDADDPAGVSIRDESVRHTLFTPGRSHTGGGLSGGK